MAKDTTRSSRFSRKRGTQIGIDSYSRGQELPTQRVHHAGLVSIGTHPDQFARKRYDIVPADPSNNIPQQALRIRRLHESAWDETVFDANGFQPLHTEGFVASILDNSKPDTVFRSEAIFDSVFYKHYSSEHHDRGSVYNEKENTSMSPFNVLEYMSGSKYYDLHFDPDIYSYRAGLQEEWMLELVAKQTYNFQQEHPMSATTGITRKLVRIENSGEIRNTNIRELYFEDFPVLLSYKITSSQTNAGYVRAAESVLNEEIFFEDNDININPLVDDTIGITNAHDPEIMRQLYFFEKRDYKHSNDIQRFYFITDLTNRQFYSNIANATFNQRITLLQNKDSSIIIDQTDSSNHGKPFNLFLNDGSYIIEAANTVNPQNFSTNLPANYMGTYINRFEIDGAEVTQEVYIETVRAGSYQSAQIKIDKDFDGKLLIWINEPLFKTSFSIMIKPFYQFRGLVSDIPLSPFNSYNKKNHINGHSGHVAETPQRYDSIAFRGLRR